MISHHEVLILLYFEGSHRLSVTVFRQHIAFFQSFVVDDHRSVIHFDRISRDANHTFDIRLGRIAGKPEDHHISARNLADTEAINEFIDKDPLLVDNAGIMLVPSTFTG